MSENQVPDWKNIKAHQDPVEIRRSIEELNRQMKHHIDTLNSLLTQIGETTELASMTIVEAKTAFNLGELAEMDLLDLNLPTFGDLASKNESQLNLQECAHKTVATLKGDLNLNQGASIDVPGGNGYMYWSDFRYAFDALAAIGIVNKDW